MTHLKHKGTHTEKVTNVALPAHHLAEVGEGESIATDAGAVLVEDEVELSLVDLSAPVDDLCVAAVLCAVDVAQPDTELRVRDPVPQGVCDGLGRVREAKVDDEGRYHGEDQAEAERIEAEERVLRREDAPQLAVKEDAVALQGGESFGLGEVLLAVAVGGGVGLLPRVADMAATKVPELRVVEVGVVVVDAGNGPAVDLCGHLGRHGWYSDR